MILVIRKYFFAFVLIHLGISLPAQDIHFSQYYASPLSLNPALTGYFDGDWRIMDSYRSQWRSIAAPFVTNALGYDQQYYYHNNHFSYGAMLVSDRSGEIHLTVNKFYATGAFHKNINIHDLSAGFQLGYVDKRISLNDLSLPEQFNIGTGAFDNSQPRSEVFPDENISYPDINIGGLWSVKLNRFQPVVGLGLFHITRPKESFYEKNFKLPTRKIMHFSGKWDVSRKVSLVPHSLMITTTKVSDMVLGTNIEYRLKQDSKDTSIFAGVSYRDGFKRNSDAVIAVVGVKYRNYYAAFSYDINISELIEATNRRGAFEIVFIYIARNSRPSKKQIPCDRF